jgi:hypothetical protein
MVNQPSVLGTRIVRWAYRAVIPTFLVMPLFWFVLNQFRVALYDGDHGPSTAFFVVVTIQDYVTWTALALCPFAIVVAMYWAIRQIRVRFFR